MTEAPARADGIVMIGDNMSGVIGDTGASLEARPSADVGGKLLRDRLGDCGGTTQNDDVGRAEAL